MLLYLPEINKEMANKQQTFLNGQYVNIEQTPASIGHRIGAALLDMVIIYMLSLGSGVVLTLAEYLPESWMVGFYAVVITAIAIYHPVCEQLMGGSVGKRALGMRVVMHNGEAVTMSASLLRWLFYYFENFGIGLLVMLCNKRNMRLGDLAGGSMVIITSTTKEAYAFNNSMQRFTYLNPEYQPTYPFAADLTWGQVSFINQTLASYTEFMGKRETENVCTLATMLARKYQVPDVSSFNSLKFLRQVVSDYNYYTWEDEDVAS